MEGRGSALSGPVRVSKGEEKSGLEEEAGLNSIGFLAWSRSVLAENQSQAGRERRPRVWERDLRDLAATKAELLCPEGRLRPGWPGRLTVNCF